MHDPTTTIAAVPAVSDRSSATSGPRPPARWPLILLALPAGVATWSGWVGLGERTGFGVVKPLPGIIDSFAINTAVALPIGVETYAAYALGAWLNRSPRISASTRRFAKWSSVGSLLLGMLGQIAYHLLEQAGIAAAPWQVTTAVSCLPVLVLGMGAGLAHMIARDLNAPAIPEPVAAAAREVEAVDEQPAADAGPDASNPDAAVPPPAPVPAIPVALPAQKHVLGPVPDELFPAAAFRYAGDLSEGRTPPVARIKDDLKVGQPRASRIRTYLGQLAEATR